MEDTPNGVSGASVQQLVAGGCVITPEPAPTHHRKTMEKRVLNRIWVRPRNLKSATPSPAVSMILSTLMANFVNCTLSIRYTSG